MKKNFIFLVTLLFACGDSSSEELTLELKIVNRTGRKIKNGVIHAYVNDRIRKDSILFDVDKDQTICYSYFFTNSGAEGTFVMSAGETTTNFGYIPQSKMPKWDDFVFDIFQDSIVFRNVEFQCP